MNFPSNEFFEEFKKTPGAISCCESCAISWLAQQIPDNNGTCMDIGSNAGKAAMSAAYGMRHLHKRYEGGGSSYWLYMIDPIYDLGNLEAWKHTIQGAPENMPWDYVNYPDFIQKVKYRIEFVSDRLISPFLKGTYSIDAIKNTPKLGYVFLDSDDHQEELVMAEVKLLEDKMVQGGIIAFHDFGNQYIGPRKGHEYLITTGKYENIEIPWQEIRDHVIAYNLEDGNNSWHMPGVALPCFVGAVKRI